MNHYLKLVNFEFNRFFKLFLVLIGITVILQTVGVVYESFTYVQKVNELLYEEQLEQDEIIDSYGTMSFLQIVKSGWFVAPIALSVVALLIYVFFIWYRDWLGKNTFIYRLLMLPSSRMNVYFSKATAIFILVIALVALQLILLPLENQILQWIVPEQFRTDLSIKQITSLFFLSILFPRTVTEFAVYYGVGMLIVATVFTAILFERSYRLKGIFYGIAFAAGAVLLFFTPLLVDAFLLKNFFFPLELAVLQIVFSFIVLAGVLATGHYLMKNKVRV